MSLRFGSWLCKNFLLALCFLYYCYEHRLHFLWSLSFLPLTRDCTKKSLFCAGLERTCLGLTWCWLRAVGYGSCNLLTVVFPPRYRKMKILTKAIKVGRLIQVKITSPNKPTTSLFQAMHPGLTTTGKKSSWELGEGLEFWWFFLINQAESWKKLLSFRSGSHVWVHLFHFKVFLS